MKTERLILTPFEMKYLRDYFEGFDGEVTRYQWPEPFARIEDARAALRTFLDEMERGDTLLLSILSGDGRFLGSVEVHGLRGDCPELGIWLRASERNRGYAQEALRAVLGDVRSKYGKRAFFYEADVRNAASLRLLHALEDAYEIVERETEALTTDSGKALQLRGHILRARGDYPLATI